LPPGTVVEPTRSVTSSLGNVSLVGYHARTTKLVMMDHLRGERLFWVVWINPPPGKVGAWLPGRILKKVRPQY
jgi:hypothetical protein